MKIKGYILGTCSTCTRILKELNLPENAELKEIKSDPITAKELEEMKKFAGSYEKLFSRVALKYRSMGLNNKQLSENDYRDLILQEYTFLKRPVFILDGKQIFIGNTKSNIESLKKALP